MRLKSHLRLIGMVAGAGLVIGLALVVRAELGPWRTARTVAVSVQSQAALADLVHELQRERGLTMIRLAAALPNEALARQRQQTDAMVSRAVALGAVGESDLSTLAAYRHRVAIGAADAGQFHGFYSAAIEDLLGRFAASARSIELAELRAPLLAHVSLLRAKEQLGQLRAIVAGQLATGRLAEAEIRRALQQLAVFDEAVAGYLDEAGTTHAGRMRLLMESTTMMSLREWVADLAAEPSARRLQPGLPAAMSWFEMATTVADELHALAAVSIEETHARAMAIIDETQAGLAWRLGAVVAGWAVSCYLVFVSLRRLLATIQRLTTDMRALLGRIEVVAGEAPAGHAADLDTGFMALIRSVDQLSALASTDALTGLLNRHGLSQLFRAERERAQRYGRPLSLVLLDIDHFKRINDESGHAAGDAVLRELAALLRRSVRAEDIMVRWGGEEFVVVAPECDETAAAALAEKLRLGVAVHDFRLPRGMTASFGVAQLSAADDLEQLVTRADTALYQAKTLGRNRVCRASMQGDDRPPRLRLVPA